MLNGRKILVCDNNNNVKGKEKRFDATDPWDIPDVFPIAV